MHFIRLFGALASIVAGAFVAIGQLINLGGTPEYGTVFGQNLVLISHVAFVFAFVGLYIAQAERSSILGQLGMVLGTIGTTLIAAIVFMELAGASGVTAAGQALEGVGSLGVYNTVGPLAFLAGIILFGVEVMRVGMFTRWTGWLLIIGAVLGLLGGDSRRADHLRPRRGGRRRRFCVAGMGADIGRERRSPTAHYAGELSYRGDALSAVW